MVSEIFDTIGEVVTAFGTTLATIFEGAVKIFYTPGTSGGSGSLTMVGTLALVGLGTGLLMWAFHYIRSLIRVRTK